MNITVKVCITSDEMYNVCGYRGSLAATEVMIEEHGADRVAAWRDPCTGATALQYAINNDDSDVLRALIRAGVDAAVASRCGAIAPLHFARTSEAVHILTAAGASLTASTSDGYTPLHCTCVHGYVEAMRAMLELSGGIPRVVLAKDNVGWTARDLTSFGIHKELLPILDKAMWEARVWSRRSFTLLIGLAAADVVKATAVRAGKTWAL